MKQIFANALIAFFFLFSGVVIADRYPDRPILLMVSDEAGGTTDFQARIVTMTSGNEDGLGMPIAVINKPGAGGRVGWNWFATRAAADGYTLGVYNVPHFIAQGIKGGVHYSTDSFEPIANWGADPAVFIVATDSPMETMEDVVDYAEEHPGRFTYFGAGLYVGHHIAALQLEKATGVRMAYAPTKGGSAAVINGVISGGIMGGISNLADAYRARKEGKVKILGVFDLGRNVYLPDVPTFIEQGYDIDNSSVNYRGLMVPKDTPVAVIDHLSALMPGIFRSVKVIQKMQAAGSTMHIMDRGEVIRMWKAREKTLNDLLSDY